MNNYYKFDIDNFLDDSKFIFYGVSKEESICGGLLDSLIFTEIESQTRFKIIITFSHLEVFKLNGD